MDGFVCIIGVLLLYAGAVVVYRVVLIEESVPSERTRCRCGYELAGLPRPCVCPECGLPSQEGLAETRLRPDPRAIRGMLFAAALGAGSPVTHAPGWWLARRLLMPSTAVRDLGHIDESMNVCAVITAVAAGMYATCLVPWARERPLRCGFGVGLAAAIAWFAAGVVDAFEPGFYTWRECRLYASWILSPVVAAAGLIAAVALRFLARSGRGTSTLTGS